ncbi:MAG: 3-phenylpropionate/cinnamic acid dioxygenase small subunit [Arenicella sp.]|jgi:3-phenylpropionate/cinnamic acid dioxygenase small subunit
MTQNIELLNQVQAFLSTEADMLDHKEYDDWLSLWADTGLYIVPVDVNTPDYKNKLNVAYDDDHMRKLRIERLQGGEAMSANAALPTVRLFSGVRVLSDEGDLVTVRCSYCLYENKGGDLRPYPAQLEFMLKRNGDSFLIEKKLVKLLRASQYLATISYIF